MVQKRYGWVGVVLATALVVCTHAPVKASPLFAPDEFHYDDGSSAEIEQIKSLIREKELDQAMAAAVALEKKYPKNSSTFNVKGTVFLAKRDRGNARASFERAFAMDRLSVAAAMNLAQIDLDEGNPPAARQRFQSILAADPKNTRAMVALAGIAAATSQDTDYELWLKRACDTDALALQPRILLGFYYLRKKDAKNAMTVALQAQNANPDDTQSIELLESAQIALGDTASAVATAGRAVKIYPDSPAAYYGLAVAQMASGDAQGVIASANQALRLKPKYSEARLILALAKFQSGKPDEALTLARQVQTDNPRSNVGLVLEGDILMSQKQFTPALKAYDAASAIEKSGTLVIKAYQALRANNASGAGEARILEWLKEYGNDIPVRFFLSTIYETSGRIKPAIDQNQRILAVDFVNVRAQNDLAWLYYRDKDSRALTAAEKAYQLAPKNSVVMDTLGWILVDQGKTERGLKLLREAASNAPRSVIIHYHFAVALAKSGDKGGARKELEGLLANGDAFAQRREAEALLQTL